MTDLRETVRARVERACREYYKVSYSITERRQAVDAATDAIMSEIDRARVGVKRWREMDSAPRDGTPVLLFNRVYGVAFAARYNPAFMGAMPWVSTLYDHAYPESSFSHWNPLPPSPDTDAVEIVSEATTTHLRHAIKRTCAELRHQAEKARQREGDYDILITRAELLERALKDTESAPQKTQSAEGTPEATQAAPVVTDAMVEAAAKALWCDRYPKHDPSEWGREDHPVRKIYFRKARAALTAALPHAKTEAQVRAEAESDLIEALITSFGGHETEYGDTIAEILEPYRPRPKDKTDD